MRYFTEREIARVVYLRDVDNLTWPTIGQRMSRPPGSCRSAYYAAKKKAGAAIWRRVPGSEVGT